MIDMFRLDHYHFLQTVINRPGENTIPRAIDTTTFNTFKLITGTCHYNLFKQLLRDMALIIIYSNNYWDTTHSIIYKETVFAFTFSYSVQSHTTWASNETKDLSLHI